MRVREEERDRQREREREKGREREREGQREPPRVSAYLRTYETHALKVAGVQL